MTFRPLAASLAALLLAAVPLTAPAQMPPAKLQPTTYASPSGEFELFVDPTDPRGAGPGRHRLDRIQGDVRETVWKKTLPFTLWKAALTDAGVTVGYGYTGGEAGIGRPVPGEVDDDGDPVFRPRPGDLVVARIAADGTVIADRTPRQIEGHHSLPSPRPMGLLVQRTADRFIVRHRETRWIKNAPRVTETWSIRRLSDGELIETREAKPDEIPAAAPARSNPREPPPLPEPIELRHLGGFAFDPPPPGTPPATVRDVVAFDVDDRGRVGLLRGETDGASFTFLRVDPDAEAGTAPIALRPNANDETLWRPTLLTWLRGDLWLAIRPGYGRSGRMIDGRVVPAAPKPWNLAAAFRIDVARGTADRLGGFDASGVTALAGMPDGGFAAIVGRYDAGTRRNRSFLARYAPDGRELWRIDSDRDDPHAIDFPDDVAAGPDGTLAVASTYPSEEQIRVFGTSGAHRRTIPMPMFDPRSPRAFLAAVGDGWAAFAPPLTQNVWRVADDGADAGEFIPSFLHGRPLAVKALAGGPSGRLWTSDGRVIARLNAEGAVDRLLGRPPSPGSLVKAQSFAVGPDGRVSVVDRFELAVYVFEPTGELVETQRHSQVGRVEPERPGVRLAKPDGGWWEIGEGPMPWDGELRVLAADGRVLKTIRRQVDRRWLEPTSAFDVGPDGGAAVGSWSAEGRPTVDLYAPDGSPLRTLMAPEWSLDAALGRDWAAFGTKAGATLLPTNGGTPRTFVAPRPGSAGGIAPTAYEVRIGGDGHTLWLWEEGADRVDRYALPPAPNVAPAKDGEDVIPR